MDTRAVLYMTFYIELCAYAPHGSRGPQVLGAEKHKNQQSSLMFLLQRDVPVETSCLLVFLGRDWRYLSTGAHAPKSMVMAELLLSSLCFPFKVCCDLAFPGEAFRFWWWSWAILQLAALLGFSCTYRNVRLGQPLMDVRQAQATNNAPFPHEQEPHACTLTINVSPCPIHTQ